MTFVVLIHTSFMAFLVFLFRYFFSSFARQQFKVHQKDKLSVWSIFVFVKVLLSLYKI